MPTYSKQEQREYHDFLDTYKIDYRTLPLIVHHYVAIGERQAQKLTHKQIEVIYEQKKVEEEECEKNGTVLIIGADFTKYLLEACIGLWELPEKLRYKIIKEYL